VLHIHLNPFKESPQAISLKVRGWYGGIAPPNHVTWKSRFRAPMFSSGLRDGAPHYTEESRHASLQTNERVTTAPALPRYAVVKGTDHYLYFKASVKWEA
jgi:hypothetical protein